MKQTRVNNIQIIVGEGILIEKEKKIRRVLKIITS